MRPCVWRKGRNTKRAVPPNNLQDMCGIVGIWQRRAGSVGDRPDACAHRPSRPRREGVWQDGRVAFGHRRLSIIDLTEASSQPMRHRMAPASSSTTERSITIANSAGPSSGRACNFAAGATPRFSLGAPPFGPRPKRRSPQWDIRLRLSRHAGTARCALPATSSASRTQSWRYQRRRKRISPRAPLM